MKLNKSLLVLGILVLVVAALVAFNQVNASAATPTATPTAAPQPTATPIPFTAKASGVAIFPRMGPIGTNGRNMGIGVPRGDDPKKSFVLVTTGGTNVPPFIPQFVQAGAIGIAEKATLKSYEWKIKGPDGSKVDIKPVVKKRHQNDRSSGSQRRSQKDSSPRSSAGSGYAG